MSIEVAIQNLADAINRLVDAGTMQTGGRATEPPATEPPEQTKRGRGRPPKAKPDVANVEEFPAEAKAAEPAPKQSSGEGVTIDAVRTILVEVVKKLGRDACGDLCRKHGAPNLSGLSPEVYAGIIEDAKSLLAEAE